MKNCKNCNIEITKGSYCSKQECQASRCHAYYLKTLARRKKIGLDNYYKYKSLPETHERIRLNNTKAVTRKRFGVDSREEILKKTNFKCGICLKKKKLVIHHIDNNGRRVNLPNNEPDNLIPCCKVCHAKIHLLGQSLI
jgi:hypothetical protein